MRHKDKTPIMTTFLITDVDVLLLFRLKYRYLMELFNSKLEAYINNLDVKKGTNIQSKMIRTRKSLMFFSQNLQILHPSSSFGLSNLFVSLVQFHRKSQSVKRTIYQMFHMKICMRRFVIVTSLSAILVEIRHGLRLIFVRFFLKFKSSLTQVKRCYSGIPQ